MSLNTRMSPIVRAELLHATPLGVIAPDLASDTVFLRSGGRRT